MQEKKTAHLFELQCYVQGPTALSGEMGSSHKLKKDVRKALIQKKKPTNPLHVKKAVQYLQYTRTKSDYCTTSCYIYILTLNFQRKINTHLISITQVFHLLTLLKYVCNHTNLIQYKYTWI